MRGLFVTGTDTSVGKTVLSAALMAGFRAQTNVLYWKPVQTGIEQDDDTAEVSRLAALKDYEIFDQGVRLPNPVSPHLAAERAGTRITVDDLLAIPEEDGSAAWIVEGAGGVMVPLNERECMADLIVALGLPVVIAARSGLGTINHTVLTLLALRSRHCNVAGVVMIGNPDSDNRAAIEHHGNVAVLGEMPRFDPLTPQSLTQWAATALDPEGRLDCLMGDSR